MLLGVSHNSQISGVIVECNEMNDLGLFQFMKLETCYFQKFKHLWPNSWCKKPKFDLYSIGLSSLESSTQSLKVNAWSFLLFMYVYKLNKQRS